MYLVPDHVKPRGHVKPRDYDNTNRRQRSDETRQRIIDTARRLMVERGYHSTTIAEIARTAEVNSDTVYQLVGRKPVLLRELIEQAISGTGEPVAAEERDYVIALRNEPDPKLKLAIYAGATRAIHARLAPLLAALRDAATTEPEALAIWREISDRRAANMRQLATDLQSVGGLRDDLPVDIAADTVWATNSAELYLMLTIERDWAPDRYEAWLVDLWSRFLLPSDRR
jgi:AcrR family transcriptional regulator